MKFKKIMLVTFLLLAILTIGAVSASDDVASDDLAVSEDGVDESPISEATSDEEVLTDSPYEEDGFDPIVAPMMELDDDEAVVDINTPDEGNFTIYVTDSDDKTSEFNHEIDENDVREGYITWNLEDLNITEVGIYKLSAKYISDSESIWVFEDYRLIVTEEPMVSFADEFFDINDDEEPIVSICCPEGLTGIFVVNIFEEDGEDWKYYDGASHIITDEDYGEYIDFTLSSFDKKINVGLYEFRVYLLNDENDEPDDEINKIDSEELSAVDSTKFWAEIYREVSLTDIDSVVFVFCPDESTGTVTVTVRKGDEDEGTSYSKDVSQSEENWLEWTLRELGITCDGEYFITVEANNTIVERGVRLGVGNPIYFNEEVSYLESDNPDRAFLVEFEISSEITGGRIIITSNGAEIFNKALSEFSDEESVDAPYWFNPRHGGDESIKIYRISNSNINPVFGEGTYELTVIADVDGLGRFNNTGEVRISKVNSKKDDDSGVEIAIYDAQEYALNDDWYSFIEISADSNEGEIIVTVEGTEFSKSIPLDDFKDGFYSLVPQDFEELGVGIYNITVAYWNEDEQVFNNTATVTFGYGEEGIMESDVSDIIEYWDDWAFNIWFATNDISGTIVIELDGVEYYRAHIDQDSFDPDDRDEHGADHFPISVRMFNTPVEFGHYNSVKIYYYGDDGFNDVDVHEDRTVANNPSIWIPDWDISIQDDDIIRVYPNSDDSQTIRVVLKIGDEVYLNATIEELGLRLKKNDQLQDYYGITADMLNQTLEIGEIYDDAIAYYYSDNFNCTSFDDEYNKCLIVAGMLDEVDCTYEGVVLAVFFSDDDGEIRIYIEGRDEPIVVEGIKDNFFTWTLDDLGLSEGFNGQIDVEYGSNQFGGHIWVVNNEEFRVKTEDTLIFFNNDTVLSVFCPQESVGKTIKLYSQYDENELIKEYVIKDDDEGVYVGFTLNDLNIDEANWYEINVYVDDEKIGDESYGFNVASAMEFNGNGIATLSEDGKKSASMQVVGLNLPFDFEGNVTIALDGVEVFNKNLKDITCDSYGEYMHYTIFTSDLDSASEGRHRMIVAFNDIKDEISITFAKSNVKSNENVTLEMFSVSCDKGDWRKYFARIEVPMDADFNINRDVNVSINGTEYNLGDLDIWEEDNWEDNTRVYYLAHKPDTFDNLGKHTMTVVCYKNGGEVVRNTDTLTLFNSPEIFVMWSNPDGDKVEYDLESDSAIHFYPNGDESNFRIIVMIGGKVYLNATRDELDLTAHYNDQNEKFYYVGPKNFKKAIAPGHYENIVAIYSNEYVDVYNTDGLMPTYMDITGEPLDPNFNITIANVEEGNPIAVSITASEAFTGDVIVKVGEKDILVHIEDGKGVNDTTGVILPAGNDYVANLTYAQTVSFKAAVAQTIFNVTAKPVTPVDPVTPTEPTTPTTPTTPSSPTKKNTKITAKKKTFKAKKKVKKYTITLKSGKTAVKKVRVTLKIGKKTYKARTNNKGKATFKIKKLTKKGKYKAVIKFAGDKNYKATSKKVKITIK